MSNEALQLINWRMTTGLLRDQERLRSYVGRGRMHPILLLQGVDGVGKRHLANFVTGLYFCETRTACGECPSCRELMRCNHLDVLWITKSEQSRLIRLDDVLAIEEHVRLKSAEGARFVVIPDADLLTKEAQNRLLKVLEEPPENSFFVLTTNRPQSILPTVLGRCLRWQVDGPTFEESVKFISAHKSSLTVEQAGLLVKRHGRSPGRLLQATESTHQSSIEADVKKLLWSVSPKHVLEAAESLAKNKSVTMPEIFQTLEWTLNDALRESLASGSAVPKHLSALREAIRQSKAMICKKNVVLNSQLVLESIGLR